MKVNANNSMNNSTIIYEKSNLKTIQALAIIAAIFAFSRDNPFAIINLLILLVVLFVIFAFYKKNVFKVNGHRIEAGIKRGFIKKLSSLEIINLIDFRKVDLIQNEKRLYEIHIFGKGNEKIKICSWPNKNLAIQKAESFEKQIKKLALT